MGKAVCVTGASGFIASWLVKLLLDRGYTVRGTVRNISDPLKVEHLKALKGAAERLHLYKADLLDDGCFDSIVDGCECVFHTASPVLLSATACNPQKELIDPAVIGTINVLESCKKASSIKRVVITSSTAAVVFNNNPVDPDVKIDETWFSDINICKEKEEWYSLAKTLAEKAAWKFAEESGLDLVILHPSYTIGPLLQPTLSVIPKSFLDLIKEGKEPHPSGISRWVDVRDVALAHMLAFENPSASGRYCIVGKVASLSQVLDILSGIFPSLDLQWRVGRKNGETGATPREVSKEKAESLGIIFTPLEVSLKDTVESLKEKKFISF